jgi:hypothetical protein
MDSFPLPFEFSFSAPPEAAASSSAHDSAAAIFSTDGLRAKTFFPLAKLSVSDVLAKRGWQNVYSSADDWEGDVLYRLGGQGVAESVIIPTADGRRLRAIYARRAYDEVLTRHQLDVLKHKGLGGEFLPKEAAALVFHAKYAPHVTKIGITPLSPH